MITIDISPLDFYLRCIHFTGEDDEQWIDFLLKAVTHNMNKLKERVNNTDT